MNGSQTHLLTPTRAQCGSLYPLGHRVYSEAGPGTQKLLTQRHTRAEGSLSWSLDLLDSSAADWDVLAPPWACSKAEPLLNPEHLYINALLLHHVRDPISQELSSLCLWDHMESCSTVPLHEAWSRPGGNEDSCLRLGLPSLPLYLLTPLCLWRWVFNHMITDCCKWSLCFFWVNSEPCQQWGNPEPALILSFNDLFSVFF